MPPSLTPSGTTSFWHDFHARVTIGPGLEPTPLRRPTVINLTTEENLPADLGRVVSAIRDGAKMHSQEFQIGCQWETPFATAAQLLSKAFELMGKEIVIQGPPKQARNAVELKLNVGFKKALGIDMPLTGDVLLSSEGMADSVRLNNAFEHYVIVTRFVLSILEAIAAHKIPTQLPPKWISEGPVSRHAHALEIHVNGGNRLSPVVARAAEDLANQLNALSPGCREPGTFVLNLSAQDFQGIWQSLQGTIPALESILARRRVQADPQLRLHFTAGACPDIKLIGWAGLSTREMGGDPSVVLAAAADVLTFVTGAVWCVQKGVTPRDIFYVRHMMSDVAERPSPLTPPPIPGGGTKPAPPKK